MIAAALASARVAVAHAVMGAPVTDSDKDDAGADDSERARAAAMRSQWESAPVHVLGALTDDDWLAVANAVPAHDVAMGRQLQRSAQWAALLMPSRLLVRTIATPGAPLHAARAALLALAQRCEDDQHGSGEVAPSMQARVEQWARDFVSNAGAALGGSGDGGGGNAAAHSRFLSAGALALAGAADMPRVHRTVLVWLAETAGVPRGAVAAAAEAAQVEVAGADSGTRAHALLARLTADLQTAWTAPSPAAADASAERAAWARHGARVNVSAAAALGAATRWLYKPAGAAGVDGSSCAGAVSGTDAAAAAAPPPPLARALAAARAAAAQCLAGAAEGAEAAAPVSVLAPLLDPELDETAGGRVMAWLSGVLAPALPLPALSRATLCDWRIPARACVAFARLLCRDLPGSQRDMFDWLVQPAQWRGALLPVAAASASSTPRPAVALPLLEALLCWPRASLTEQLSAVQAHDPLPAPEELQSHVAHVRVPQRWHVWALQRAEETVRQLDAFPLHPALRAASLAAEDACRAAECAVAVAAWVVADATHAAVAASQSTEGASADTARRALLLWVVGLSRPVRAAAATLALCWMLMQVPEVQALESAPQLPPREHDPAWARVCGGKAAATHVTSAAQSLAASLPGSVFSAVDARVRRAAAEAAVCALHSLLDGAPGLVRACLRCVHAPYLPEQAQAALAGGAEHDGPSALDARIVDTCASLGEDGERGQLGAGFLHVTAWHHPGLLLRRCSWLFAALPPAAGEENAFVSDGNVARCVHRVAGVHVCVSFLTARQALGAWLARRGCGSRAAAAGAGRRRTCAGGGTRGAGRCYGAFIHHPRCITHTPALTRSLLAHRSKQRQRVAAPHAAAVIDAACTLLLRCHAAGASNTLLHSGADAVRVLSKSGSHRPASAPSPAADAHSSAARGRDRVVKRHPAARLAKELRTAAVTPGGLRALASPAAASRMLNALAPAFTPKEAAAVSARLVRRALYAAAPPC